MEELSLRSWVVVQNLVGTPALNGSLARPTRAKLFILLFDALVIAVLFL